MAQDYKHDLGLNKINTMLKVLENDPNRTEEDIKKAMKNFELIKKVKNYSEDVLKDFEDRFNALSNIGLSTDTPMMEASEPTETEEIQKLSDISPRSVRVNKILLKGTIAAIASGIVVGISGYTLTSCGKNVEPAPVAVENVIETSTVEEEIKEKILPEDWAFDPNDNIELVNRMSQFIYDAVEKGIPVKDVMTEEEISLANSKEESLVTIEQLMDFYMVMNIEDIDPSDYARLQYFTKTKETIVDNYSYCARIFMTDSLTATKDTEINYAGIINDKESSKVVQKFVDYLAEYNTSTNKKELNKEIFEYINSTYINRDANIYSMSSNEFTYRLMFDADLISNNSIIPKDVNIILNEDGKLTCASSDKKDDGIKDKTERAEEYTSLSNAVEQKLEISREFYNQDLTKVSIDEQKTGVELEKEIKEKVIAMNVEYHANEKFTMSVSSKGITAAKETTTKKDYTTFTNGKNVSNAEMAKYGAKNQAEYESAKKAEFDKKAQEDSNHTIKDPNGTVVVNGSEANSEQYNSGYAAGYYDGNNKLSNNPTVSNESYKAGYNVGYSIGLEDRNKLDSQFKQQQPTTSYESIDNGNSTIINETTIENTYTNDVPEVNEQPIIVPDTPSEPVIIIEEQPYIEEFVPVEESIVTESIDETNYTSSIKELEKLKNELLNLSGKYTTEETHQKC